MKHLPQVRDQKEVNQRFIFLLEEVFSDTDYLFNQIYNYAKDAEFIKYSTGRMDDATATLNALKSVLISALRHFGINGVAYLDLTDNNQNLLSPITEVAKRHHFRGITLDFFMKCWKVIVHGIEDRVKNLEKATPHEIIDLLFLIKRCYDACETVFINEWLDVNVDTLQKELMENTRKMTLEKCKYQNVFEGSSDLIIITDKNGKIEELNKVAKEYFESKNIDYNNTCICKIFSKTCDDLFDPFNLKTYGEPKYINLFGREYFMLKIVSLRDVELNYDRYLIVLNDVTGITVKNKILEMEVYNKTKELMRSKKFLNAVFTSTNAGIIILDSKLNIYNLNNAARMTLNLSNIQLSQLNVDKFIFSAFDESLSSIISSLESDNSWSGELIVSLKDTDIYVLANISAIEVDGDYYYSLIFIDISRIIKLEEELLIEKQIVEEKNITLKNVIQTLTQDSKRNVDEIWSAVKSELMPMIDKIVEEKSKSGREILKREITSYLISNEDSKIETSSSGGDSSLTFTENQVCELIKIGFSTKEISEKLNITIDTVQTHRKNIRKKFGIVDKSINLYSYIKTKY
jgi:PAS domain S-box-containing protein